MKNFFFPRKYLCLQTKEEKTILWIVWSTQRSPVDRRNFEALNAVANRLRRRTLDQTVLGSNPAVAAARVESLDKALHSHCPKEKPSH